MLLFRRCRCRGVGDIRADVHRREDGVHRDVPIRHKDRSTVQVVVEVEELRMEDCLDPVDAEHAS